jgi:hypothetical protein
MAAKAALTLETGNSVSEEPRLREQIQGGGCKIGACCSEGVKEMSLPPFIIAVGRMSRGYFSFHPDSDLDPPSSIRYALSSVRNAFDLAWARLGARVYRRNRLVCLLSVARPEKLAARFGRVIRRIGRASHRFAPRNAPTDGLR